MQKQNRKFEHKNEKKTNHRELTVVIYMMEWQFVLHELKFLLMIYFKERF